MGDIRQVDALAQMVSAMQSRHVDNYVVPGLTSSLVGGGYQRGNVRLLEAERDTREWVTPHSHRFDFACLVLRGKVENILFTPSASGLGEQYVVGELLALTGGLGDYRFTRGVEPKMFDTTSRTHCEGDVYSMKASEIHSIRFDRGSMVLFFEGPPYSAASVFLEPWANGKPVPTFTVQKWMFEHRTTPSESAPHG